MKILILFLPLWLVVDAQAISRPSPQDVADIRMKISAAKRAEEAITRAEDRLSKTTDSKTIDKYRKEITTLVSKRDFSYKQALWLTIRAYDIMDFDTAEPVFIEGTSVRKGPQNGKKLTWVPVFEDKRPYRIQDVSGKVVTTLTLPDDAGNTATDGVSRIFPDAFSSPAELASLIVHERLHFKQFTTHQLGDVKTQGQLEVEAYEKEEEILKYNIFGFTGEEKARSARYLAENLARRKAQASAELAKKARGLTIDEFSIVAHTDAEIQELIKQAREQVKIAQIDHDDRLRRELIRLARKSCDNPGSVTRAELAALPRPHFERFWTTKGPERCYEEYAYMAKGGVDPQELRRISTPVVPARPVDAPQSQPLRVVATKLALPSPPSAPAQVRPVRFDSVLARLQDFARSACGTVERLPLDAELFRPDPPYSFSRTEEDQTIDRLSRGLKDCDGKLFLRLVEAIRSGEGDRVTAQWVQETAAAYRNGGGGGTGNGAPQPRGVRCEDYPNLRCP